MPTTFNLGWISLSPPLYANNNPTTNIFISFPGVEGVCTVPYNSTAQHSTASNVCLLFIMADTDYYIYLLYLLDETAPIHPTGARPTTYLVLMFFSLA